MTSHFDALETRSADERAAQQSDLLQSQVALAARATGSLLSADSAVANIDDLQNLPVMRKSDLVKWQSENPPFGGMAVSNVAHIFQSPGPIYEPGGISHDWWRIGRFLSALGLTKDDIIQNCFGYHLTPAGMIFESGARAIGAAVLPAGTGQTELQVRAV